MRRPYAYLSFLILLVLAIGNVYLLFKHYNNTHITCEGDWIEIGNDHNINMRLYLSLDGSKGESVFEGSRSDYDGNRRNLRRSSSFSFTPNGNSYHLFDTSVSELAGNTMDVSELKGVLPSSVLFSGANFIVNFYPVGDRGYLIMKDESIMLYCYK